MRRHSRRLGVTLNVAALVLLLVPVRAAQISFARGDIFVSIETTGSVHWYYYTSDVYRIDLASGSLVDSFNTGTPPNTAVDVIVMP